MRLERLTPAHVRRALDVYLERAYPESEGVEPKIDVGALRRAETLEQMGTFFERPGRDEGVACQRFTLRLGNHRYPFMKLVVQEYLVREEYFFSVDTHDDLRVTPDMPDYDEWMRLKAFNQDLKERIEQGLHDAGLPTNDDLRRLMAEIERMEGGEAHGARVLVVDDEVDVAQAVRSVLRARGYRVELAHDGRQVLDRLARDPLPDLVVLDYAMPELDGWQVLERMRADPRTRDLKVLLATATDIDLGMLERCNGLLRKPYPREMLIDLVERLCAPAGEGTEAGSPDGLADGHADGPGSPDPGPGA